MSGLKLYSLYEGSDQNFETKMKWIGITGTWKVTNQEVEKDVRNFVREVIKRGDGIVVGGAPGVDYFATDEALVCNPQANHIRVFIPATLVQYAAYYRQRANEGVCTHEQAEGLIAQLTKLQHANPAALTENIENKPINRIAFFARNTQIVNASDELAAFQVNESLGTQNTIDTARAQGKVVRLRQYSIF